MKKGRNRLGRNVRRLRLIADLTQEDAAAKAGTERAYWSEIERGNKNPTIDVIDRIAEALNADISELFLPLDEEFADTERKQARVSGARK